MNEIPIKIISELSSTAAVIVTVIIFLKAIENISKKFSETIQGIVKEHQQLINKNHDLIMKNSEVIGRTNHILDRIKT